MKKFFKNFHLAIEFLKISATLRGEKWLLFQLFIIILKRRLIFNGGLKIAIPRVIEELNLI